MAGLGVDSPGNTALAQTLDDPVGIPDGGIKPQSQFLCGDLVGAGVADDGGQLLDGHSGKTALFGNGTDIRHLLGGDDHALFGVQRADEVAVAVRDEGFTLFKS